MNQQSQKSNNALDSINPLQLVIPSDLNSSIEDLSNFNYIQNNTQNFNNQTFYDYFLKVDYKKFFDVTYQYISEIEYNYYLDNYLVKPYTYITSFASYCIKHFGDKFFDLIIFAGILKSIPSSYSSGNYNTILSLTSLFLYDKFHDPCIKSFIFSGSNDFTSSLKSSIFIGAFLAKDLSYNALVSELDVIDYGIKIAVSEFFGNMVSTMIVNVIGSSIPGGAIVKLMFSTAGYMLGGLVKGYTESALQKEKKEDIIAKSSCKFFMDKIMHYYLNFGHSNLEKFITSGFIKAALVYEKIHIETVSNVTESFIQQNIINVIDNIEILKHFSDQDNNSTELAQLNDL